MKRKMLSIVARHGFASSAVGLICFVAYLSSMCRTVSFIDAGELASVAGLLGIAHPTGYPLFTLLAHCFLWLPIPSDEILKLNIFSGVIVALAVGAFYHVLIAAQRYARAMSRNNSQVSTDSALNPEIFRSATGYFG